MRKLGLDVSRWPGLSPDYLSFSTFLACSPTLVVDVGANRGQFVEALREAGYGGRIHSVEPAAGAFEQLERASKRDPQWTIQRAALGSSIGQGLLHLSANDAESSSLVQMTARHSQAAPCADFTGATELVPIDTLDQVLIRQARGQDRIAVKIDVQGYERQVLLGGLSTLHLVTCLQLELSLQALYEDHWDWRSAIGWLEDHGFHLSMLSPGLFDKDSLELLQIDATFARKGGSRSVDKS